MGLYRQQRSPFWWASFTGPDGKRTWESTGLSSKRAAAEWLERRRVAVMRERADLEDRRRTGAPPPPKPVTMGEVAAQIKRDYLPVELRDPRYVRCESRRLDSVVKWFGADTLVASVTSAKIAEYRAALRQPDETGWARGGAAANRILSRLSNLLHLACEWEYLDAVPVIRRFPEPKRVVPLNRAHVDRLIAFAACRPTLRDALVFAAGTGCRAGELEALRWSGIDLDAGTIRFMDTKNGEDRVIGILPEVRELLKRLRAALPAPVPADAPVLRSPKGRAFRLPGWARKHFVELVKRAGLPAGTTFHCIRHVFATWSRGQGWPRDVIKKWMGHKTDQAAARYSHVGTGELLEAAAGKWDRKPAGKCDTGVILAKAVAAS